jgi:hypothetical protein
MVMVQRSEVAERSVYVRGFSNVPSAEDDLREVMGRFGGVVSVAVVARDSNTYALVEFVSVAAALGALRHPTPLTLHTHTLTVKPRLLKPTKLPKRTAVLGQRKRLDVAIATARGVAAEVRGEEVVLGGIRLTPEAVAALSAAPSVCSQLEALASHCRLSHEMAQQQLSIAWQLQAKLRFRIPSCLVVPFGAPFSGHGTVSSDCDLCLLTSPTSLDLSIFLGPAYLPAHLLSCWERLQATRPMPGHSSREGQWAEPGLQEVLVLLEVDPSCSGVWAVRSARVPIVRFVCEGLHCDLSINNRLGPANTRLLAAYMRFDHRMEVLVPCVRLWMRGWGLGRSQINNYAVSLLLIHSLQHTSPPVLPCLQVTTCLSSQSKMVHCCRISVCGLEIWLGLAAGGCRQSSRCIWTAGTAPSLTLSLSSPPPILPLPV